MAVSEEDKQKAHKRPRGIQPSDEEVRSQFPALFYSAVRRRNASKIHALAKLAGAEKWDEAVGPLCDFLMPPSAKWYTPRRSPRGWPEARAAAVWALQQTGRPMANRALAYTLACDSDFTVRSAANAALQSLRRSQPDSHVSSMVATVRAQIDWNLDGMRALLTALGDPADLPDAERRAAGMVLMDVLYENFPESPRRWTRHARRAGRLVAVLTMLLVTLAFHNDGWELFPALLMSLIPGQIAGFCAKIAASFLCIAGYGQSERPQLYAIAAQSIVRLNDKRAIPGMLQLAFDAPLRATGRHARAVLLSLLPQVTAQDLGLFTSVDLENVNNALAQALNPDLMLALLHTLEAVGSGESIRRVRRLIKRTRSEEIRIKATWTLEVLEAREAKVKLAKTLLRGTQAPQAHAGEMLRAALPVSTDPPEQLLRATHGDSNE